MSYAFATKLTKPRTMRTAKDGSRAMALAAGPQRSVLQRTCACGGTCPRCRGEAHTAADIAISQPADASEREADHIAEQVMRAPRSPAAAQVAAEPALPANALAPAVPTGVPPIVDEVLRSPGQPLDAATRAFMEPRFGQDFSQVRVHADETAARSAASVQALGYTVGNHVVFGDGQYAPRNAAGQQLLAHELAHTVQQGRGGARIDRQCDPAWAGLDWSARVSNVRAMANGTPRDQCMTDMIDEALTGNVIMHESTNTRATLAAAIAHGDYTEMGTIADLHVNFDRNLNAKTGNASQWGETRFITPTPNSIEIYIVLGPRALDPVGPQHTRMAFDHENSHATDFLIQFATGTPHAATAGEELAIHTEGFSLYFLDLWTIDNAAGSFQISNTFSPIFTNFGGATPQQQDAAFDSIKMFFDVRITPIPCNLMKFKIWLQMMQNAQPANDALIARINALPGLGLTRTTSPSTHFNPALGCQ